MRRISVFQDRRGLNSGHHLLTSCGVITDVFLLCLLTTEMALFTNIETSDGHVYIWIFQRNNNIPYLVLIITVIFVQIIEHLQQRYTHIMMNLETINKWPGLQTILLFIGPIYVAYWLCVFTYRVTLHPLSKFPGPKLAAATFWYEFYYDVWPRQYQYMWKIEELHKKYGECSSCVRNGFQVTKFPFT